jgi:hypothetical protein
MVCYWDSFHFSVSVYFISPEMIHGHFFMVYQFLHTVQLLSCPLKLLHTALNMFLNIFIHYIKFIKASVCVQC